MEEKTLSGNIPYEITIVGKNINMRLQQSNENHLVAFEMVRKITQEMLEKKYRTPHAKKDVKPLEDCISYLEKQISLLGLFVIDKYKDAVPEEKKVKLIQYDPRKHKLPNLKK